MSFDLNNAKIVPFNVTEDDLRKVFISFLTKSDTAPIDLSARAKIKKIIKKMYPVRCFNVSYFERWEATSIWEHDEPYTEYKSETIFIDYQGNEHKNMGYDVWSRGYHVGTSMVGGKDHTPWKPQQKIVPITKYKTVIDNIEDTHGAIQDTSFVPIVTYNEDDPLAEQFTKWLIDCDIKNLSVDYNEDYTKNCDIMPLLQSNEYAENLMISKIKQLAHEQCCEAIPGDRYEDLVVHELDINSNMFITLLPYYHIEYEYNQKTYECWRSGIKEKGFIYNEMPEDEMLSSRIKKEQKNLTIKKRIRLLLGLITFLIMPFMLFLLPIGSDVSIDEMLVIQIICIIVFTILNIYTKYNIKKYDGYIDNLRNLRKSVSDVVKNDALSEKEKKEQIEKVLASNGVI